MSTNARIFVTSFSIERGLLVPLCYKWHVHQYLCQQAAAHQTCQPDLQKRGPLQIAAQVLL